MKVNRKTVAFVLELISAVSLAALKAVEKYYLESGQS